MTQNKKSPLIDLSPQKMIVAAIFLIVLALLITLYDARKEKIRGDFTEYSLAASRALFAGENPYSREAVGKNYKYFPTNAVLLGPLTLVPIPMAQGIWLSLNIGLLLWCFKEHRTSILMKSVPFWVWIIALALTIRYISANLKMGQWNTSVYCLAFIGWALTQRKRPLLGGSLIGLAATLKFLPGLLVFYFFAKRKWREATATLVSFLFFVFIMPAFIIGPARHFELLSLYRHKGEASYKAMLGKRYVVGYSLNATLYGYLTEAKRLGGPRIEQPFNILNIQPKVSRPVVDSLMALMLIGAFVFSARTFQKPNTKNEESDSLIAFLEIGLWFLLFLAISPEVRRAHLITTFTPAFALSCVLASKNVTHRGKTIAAASLIICGFLMITSSTIVKGTMYNEILCIYGSYTFSFLALTVGSIILILNRKNFIKDLPDDD